jgi:hypothetical protein
MGRPPLRGVERRRQLQITFCASPSTRLRVGHSKRVPLPLAKYVEGLGRSLGPLRLRDVCKVPRTSNKTQRKLCVKGWVGVYGRV